MKRHRLSLGEFKNLAIPVFSRGVALVYTGQVNDYVYSIAVISKKGNNSFSFNLYFNADQPEFRLMEGVIKVLSVDAGFIEFAYEN